MIRLEGVSKRFGDGRAAVEALDLEVADGETCILIGPSGCGKTTTLRMINRLIEPSSGRIVVEGQDVTQGDPVQLRRRIGYVIQGVGLFPHLTIADNIATVPRLLGWPEARVAPRVDEMLRLVGLDAAEFARRKPASLSGGQRQRAGVARALAADPPVMLMDEPFGAVDPIVRGRLQRDIGDILRSLGKTVVMVTHDIDEAVRMGDRIAIMRDGRLVEHASPDRLLARPETAFAAEFVGPARALKRLALTSVGEICSPVAPAGPRPAVAADASLQIALSTMLSSGTDELAVTMADGRPDGAVGLAAIRDFAAHG